MSLMRRTGILAGIAISIVAVAWLIQFAPASVRDIFEHPFHVIIGSGHGLNSSLLDASENVETVRDAGRTLLKPLGMVTLIRSIPSMDSLTKDKISEENKRH